LTMSWIWTGFIAVSILCAALTGRGNMLSTAAMQGARSAVELVIAMTGSLCLWSGVGALMQQLKLSHALAGLLRPVLRRIFPESERDDTLAGALSANICANLLGLGNAATPMGIAAAKRLRRPEQPECATDSLCRLVVLNTASIQLIPSSVAAVRLSLGCVTPFDILPAVWITSFCSAALGLAAAFILGRMWRSD